MKSPWPHQIDAEIAVQMAIHDGRKRILLAIPTGGGKTYVAASLIRLWVAEGLRVTIYTNRRLMVEQLSQMLTEYGIDHGIRAAGHKRADYHPVQICSIQTEQTRTRKAKDLSAEHVLHGSQRVVVDEAHLNCSDGTLAILNQHIKAGASVLGLTATPIDLGHFYEVLIQSGLTSELRVCGALVPALHFGPDEPDLAAFKRLKKLAGMQEGQDLSEAQARALIMTPTIWGRVSEWFDKLNPDQRPTILFAPGVSESLWFAEQFSKKGIPAAHIDGKNIWLKGELYNTSQKLREEVLDGSRTGRIPVLCNRFVLREGIDAGWIQHMIFATVFGSLQTFLQSGGRGLRAYPGKENLTVQDHGGCLDTQTEILTDCGWKGRDDVTEDTTVATLNLETHAMEWSPVLGLISKPLDGRMKFIDSPHLDIRVTDYHEMVMRPDLRRGRWRKIKAGELCERGSNWVIPVAALEPIEDCRLTDSEIGFIGWFLTDGCMDGARIRIYQSANSPLSHHDHIRQCLDGCEFRYSVRKRIRPSPFGNGDSPEVIYSVSSGRKSDRGWDHLTEWLDKSFPLRKFDLLSRRQFKVLLEAMNLGDGLKHTTYDQATISLAVANKEAADSIQSLAVRRGYRCNMAEQRQGGLIYILHTRDSSLATVAKGAFRESVEASGEEVWCVQTKTGTIITRRRGKVAIVGNSWWRHGSLNADRIWKLDQTASMISGLRADAMREGKIKSPFRCPDCAAIVASGRCSNCGWRPQTLLVPRPVVGTDGSLRLMRGDIYKKRFICQRSDGPAIWERMFWRSRTEKGARTFRAAMALFAQENYWQWPSKDWPFMPIDEMDTFRLVGDVPFERLIPKEAGNGKKEAEAS